MVHVLTVRPETPLAAVEGALARTRQRRIALSFPARQPSRLADERTLESLASYCAGLGKDVLIVGGDDRLRALAVAAGFVVATSLDDDEPHPRLGEIAAPSPQAWEQAEVRFVVHRAPRATMPLSLDDDLADEPPDYVRDLLERDGTYRRAPDDDTAQARRAPRVTRPLEPLDDDELLRLEAEAQEERITSRIRDSGSAGAGDSRPRPFTLPRVRTPRDLGAADGERA